MDTASGIISKIDYSLEHPMTMLLLLPLLQKLAAQSRFDYYKAWPHNKNSRYWLQQSDLPLDKVIQPYHFNPNETVDAMGKRC
ncbi:MAG: SulA-like leucine-rich domain-containing protein [Symbiopectobacterium sp.]